MLGSGTLETSSMTSAGNILARISGSLCSPQEHLVVFRHKVDNLSWDFQQSQPTERLIILGNKK